MFPLLEKKLFTLVKEAASTTPWKLSVCPVQRKWTLWDSHINSVLVFQSLVLVSGCIPIVPFLRRSQVTTKSVHIFVKFKVAYSHEIERTSKLTIPYLYKVFNKYLLNKWRLCQDLYHWNWDSEGTKIRENFLRSKGSTCCIRTEGPMLIPSRLWGYSSMPVNLK